MNGARGVRCSDGPGWLGYFTPFDPSFAAVLTCRQDSRTEGRYCLGDHVATRIGNGDGASLPCSLSTLHSRTPPATTLAPKATRNGKKMVVLGLKGVDAWLRWGGSWREPPFTWGECQLGPSRSCARAAAAKGARGGDWPRVSAPSGAPGEHGDLQGMNAGPREGGERLTWRTFPVQPNVGQRPKGEGKPYTPLALAWGRPEEELRL